MSWNCVEVCLVKFGFVGCLVIEMVFNVVCVLDLLVVDVRVLLEWVIEVINYVE